MTDAWPGTPVDQEWPGTPADDAWPGQPVAAAPEPKREGMLKAFGSGFGAGATGLAEQAGTLYGLGTGTTEKRGIPVPETAPVEERTRDYSIWQKITDPEWLAYNIGQTIPQSAPFLGGALAGGAAGTAVLPGVGTLIGAMIGGGGTAGAQALADSYNEARRAGQDHDKALDTAMYSALASAGINAASIPAGLFGLAKGPISYALRQMVVQPAIGGGEQAVQNLIARERGVDPERPLMQGVPESAFLEAIFEAPTHAYATRRMAREVGAKVEPPPDLVAPAQAETVETKPVEAPAKAPDVNEPFGLERDGQIVPTRVLDYFDQDGVTYARLAQETPEGATMAPVEVVAVEDLLPMVREAQEAAEIEGEARPVEPVTEADDVARFGESDVRDVEPTPQASLELERPGPRNRERRLDQMTPDQLTNQGKALSDLIANSERNRDIVVNNYTADGLSVEQAEQRLSDNIERWRTGLQDLNAEIERRRVGEQPPPVEPTTGVAPLLYQRPEVSEADTGPIGGGATMRVARPEPEARASTPLLEQRPARSEATEGPIGGAAVWRPREPELAPQARRETSPTEPATKGARIAKPTGGTSILERIRMMGGVSSKDANLEDVVSVFGGRQRAMSPLRVNRNGRALDQLRGDLAAEGYTGVGGKPLTTVSDLIDAIEAERRGQRNVGAAEVGDELMASEMRRYEALRDQYGDNPDVADVPVNDAAAVADMHEAANERAFDAYENGNWELEPVAYLETEGGDLRTPSPENLTQEDIDVATGRTQEKPVNAEQVSPDVGARGLAAEPAQKGQATRGAAREGREAPREGATFERVRNVEGATEQGVLGGTEQSARQAQAKRDAEGGLRGKGQQKPPGGLFEEPDTTDYLFERDRRPPPRGYLNDKVRPSPEAEGDLREIYDIARDTYDQDFSPAEAEAELRGQNLTERQQQILNALKKDDYFGFDYPHQAIAEIIRGNVAQYDPSPETLRVLGLRRERVKDQQGSGITYWKVRERPDEFFEVQGPIRETPELSEAAVREAIAAIAGPAAAARAKVIPGQTGFRGGYDKARAIIEVAVRSPDMRGTLRHESLHYLKDMGAFSDPEWNTLMQAAPAWRKKYDIDRRYTGDVVRRADGKPVSEAVLEAVRNEEAVAAAYAEWARGDAQGLPARIRALFERIRAILDQIRAQIMGSPLSARAIFYDMDNGRFVPNATRAERERFGNAATDAAIASANVAAEGAHATGNNPTLKETDRLRMWERDPASKKTDPRWLSWGTRTFSFPLARAANDERFAPYVSAELSREKRESGITFAVNQGLEPIFRLPRKEQEDVRKALELIALNNAFPPVVNGRMAVQNNTGKVARLTGPKRVVRLSPEATKAMVSYKRAMDTAWDAFAQGAVKAATSYTGDMNVKAAQAEAQRLRDTGNPRGAKEAEMAAAILQAAAEKKRQGYYPAMRKGDTAVIVRRKLTPEFARIVGQAKGRGYPKDQPITGARLQEFVDAAQTPQETRFWSELKSDFDDERARLGTDSANDEMVWNEHFYVKPPFMGEVVPMTQRAVQAAKDAKIKEVKALMEKRGLDMSNYEIVTRDVKDDLRSMISDESVPVLEKLIKIASEGDPKMYAEVWPKVRESIGRELLAGFRRPSNAVPGFSMEIGDTLSRYSHSVGSVAARLEYKRQIDDALDAIIQKHPDPAMRGSNGYAATLKNYLDDPSQDYNKLKSFGFMYYLAGVPSTAVQNLTQVGMIAVPQMTGIMGPRGAAVVGNAWRESLAAVRVGKDGIRLDLSKIGKTEGEKAFIRQMEAEGQISATVTRELMGRDFDVGPRLQAAQTFWQKVYTAAASMFDTAEGVNRATALLAGYRAAQMPGVQEKLARVYGENQNYKQLADRNGTMSPEAFGEFFSREVNFEGGRVNRPEALRGLGGVILQFKSYPMNYISLMRRSATQMGPEGKTAFAMMLGMMLLGGGLMGLPFAEDFADAFDGITKLLLDEDPQAVATLTRAMQDWGLSDLGAEMVMRGVSRPSGVDLSRTLGMGNVMPRMDDPVQVLGPTASALASVYYGHKRLEGGQSLASAAMEVAPRALKGPIQAARVLPEEGLVSRSNRQIIPPSEITGGQQASRALGFQPTAFSREYERRGYRQEITAEAQRVATKLRTQYQRLNSLAADQDKQGRKQAAEETRERARKVAENMIARGIKPPVGRDAFGPNLDAEGAAIKQAPRRVREEMSRNPYVGRE